MTERELHPVITYPRDAIVETAHIAAAMHCSEETVKKMDLPCFYPGTRPRYLWGQVLDELARRANPDAAVELTHRNDRRAHTRRKAS